MPYLLSTPNMLPISVCFSWGFFSWISHIFLRSSSVKVFRGWDGGGLAGMALLGEGDIKEGMLMGGAEWEVE